MCIYSKVVILAGVSGSGKTTYAKKNYPDKPVFSTDNYFKTGPKGEYQFDARRLGEAHSKNLRDFIQACQDIASGRQPDTTLVVDNTNTTVAEIAPYYAVAQAFGIPAEVVVIKADPELAHQRNEHKVEMKTVFDQANRLNSLATMAPPWWPISEVQAEFETR